MFAQPVYQQPVPQKKKKSKAPVIIICTLLILIILCGSWVAYLTFFDKNGAKNYLGVDWNFADFTQLSSSQETTFLELVDNVNTGILTGSSRKLRKGMNTNALGYVCESFGCSDENDFIAFCAESVASCGSNITASTDAYLKYEIKDTKSLAKALEKKCGAEFDISKAYLVEAITEYKGDKDSKTLKDVYILLKDGDNWSVIMLAKGGAKDLDIE